MFDIIIVISINVIIDVRLCHRFAPSLSLSIFISLSSRQQQNSASNHHHHRHHMPCGDMWHSLHCTLTVQWIFLPLNKCAPTASHSNHSSTQSLASRPLLLCHDIMRWCSRCIAFKSMHIIETIRCIITLRFLNPIYKYSPYKCCNIFKIIYVDDFAWCQITMAMPSNRQLNRSRIDDDSKRYFTDYFPLNFIERQSFNRYTTLRAIAMVCIGRRIS